MFASEPVAFPRISYAGIVMHPASLSVNVPKTATCRRLDEVQNDLDLSQSSRRTGRDWTDKVPTEESATRPESL